MVKFFLHDVRKSIFELRDLGPLVPVKNGGQSQILESNLLINEKNQGIIIKLYGKDPCSLRWFSTEYKILAEAKHPVIIKLVGLLDHPSGPALMLKKASPITLAHVIHQLKVSKYELEPFVIRYVFRRLLKALSYLHADMDRRIFPHGVIHGDISSHNVVFSTNGRCMLIDFGAAILSPKRTKRAFGLQRYLAPEQFLGHANFACDLYSLGVLIFELSLHRSFNLDRLACDFKDLCSFFGSQHQDMFGLLRAMLAPCPSYRPKSAMLAFQIKGLSKKQTISARNNLAFLVKDLSE